MNTKPRERERIGIPFVFTRSEIDGLFDWGNGHQRPMFQPKKLHDWRAMKTLQIALQYCHDVETRGPAQACEYATILDFTVRKSRRTHRLGYHIFTLDYRYQGRPWRYRGRFERSSSNGLRGHLYFLPAKMLYVPPRV